MSLLKKAATFTVFTVGQEDKSLTAQELKKLVQKQVIPVIEGTIAQDAFGFCSMEDLFEVGVTESGGVLGFGIRHDGKKISKALAKRLFDEQFAEMKETAKLERRKITKEDKKLLKEKIEGDLYLKAKPEEKHYEVIWDTRNNLIYVGSGSGKIVAGAQETFMKALPTVKFDLWDPISEKTKHVPEMKGTPENFQNAFFTWIFKETKINPSRCWNPMTVKLINDDATITVKGDTSVSLETFFSLLASRLVDGLDMGYKIDEEHKIEVTLQRGSWAIKKLKIMPEMNFETTDAAIFERAGSFKEFLDLFQGLVQEFEAVRNDEKSNREFWKSIKDMSNDRIKREFVEA